MHIDWFRTFASQCRSDNVPIVFFLSSSRVLLSPLHQSNRIRKFVNISPRYFFFSVPDKLFAMNTFIFIEQRRRKKPPSRIILIVRFVFFFLSAHFCIPLQIAQCVSKYQHISTLKDIEVFEKKTCNAIFGAQQWKHTHERDFCEWTTSAVAFKQSEWVSEWEVLTKRVKRVKRKYTNDDQRNKNTHCTWISKSVCVVIAA